MRPWPLPLFLAVSLPLSGCCSLARLFCGPDRTPWVSVDYTTPELAVRTLLEALRRGEPEIVYLSLSPDYARRLGVDDMTLQLAWPRIQEANPGLHVAGYAEVPRATRLGADRARVQLDVEGTPVTVEIVRQAQWRVRYARPELRPGEPTPPGEPGAIVPSLAGLLTITPDPRDQRSRVQVAALDVRHDGLDEIGADQIEFVGIELLWKVDDLRVEPDQD